MWLEHIESKVMITTILDLRLRRCCCAFESTSGKLECRSRVSFWLLTNKMDEYKSHLILSKSMTSIEGAYDIIEPTLPKTLLTLLFNQQAG